MSSCSATHFSSNCLYLVSGWKSQQVNTLGANQGPLPWCSDIVTLGLSLISHKMPNSGQTVLTATYSAGCIAMFFHVKLRIFRNLFPLVMAVLYTQYMHCHLQIWSSTFWYSPHWICHDSGCAKLKAKKEKTLIRFDLVSLSSLALKFSCFCLTSLEALLGPL